MSGALHYKSNLRDVFFNLFEMNGMQNDVLGKGRFANLDETTVRDMLEAIEKLSVNELAKSFYPSDRTPLKLDGEGNVTVPQEINDALDKFYEGGWNYLEVREELGGIGAPPSVGWAAFEMVAGASPVVAFYSFGSFVARVLDAIGTEEQKARFVGPALEGGWGGTMMLSEPNAGSDVGAGTTKAKQLDDGTWAIEGTKVWITSGDFDHPENILHMVLARPEGAGPGTKGLSLFVVPKIWVNEDGSLGERNGIVATAIEHKMGIKGSATCVMSMGEEKPCRGFLVGDVHDGIRQMFMVIEQARMAIGFKSMTTLSAAYQNALAYAKDRVQGPDLAKAADKTSPRVRIIEHPDVRRILMLQKSYAEGMRALCYYATSVQDQIEVLGGHKAEGTKELERLNDLLLPLVKGFNSEKAYEMLALSLQTLGGSGFVQDHPMEQYIRDQKIDTLYEGTTHIQALDLIFRKIMRDGGQTLMALGAKIQATASGEGGGDELAAVRGQVLRSLGDVQGIMGALMGKAQESIYHAGVQGNRVLFALAQTVMGWLLLEQAIVASGKVEDATGDDKSFYQGKLAVAKFFAEHVLPETTLLRKLVENGTLGVMDIPEDAF